MNTITTELVDITKNIKWSFLGDANNTCLLYTSPSPRDQA